MQRWSGHWNWPGWHVPIESRKRDIRRKVWCSEDALSKLRNLMAFSVTFHSEEYKVEQHRATSWNKISVIFFFNSILFQIKFILCQVKTDYVFFMVMFSVNYNIPGSHHSCSHRIRLRSHCRCHRAMCEGCSDGWRSWTGRPGKCQGSGWDTPSRHCHQNSHCVRRSASFWAHSADWHR